MSDVDFSNEFQLDFGQNVPQVWTRPPSPGVRAETVYKEDGSHLGMTQYIPEAGLQLRKPRKFRRTPSGMIDCYHVLRKVFKKEDFKGEQKRIVEAAVLGADVFVVAPTGMGKSLCFQIPAVADRHGITIVISPLLALMKNQVAKLHELGVPARSFTSETPPDEKAAIVKDLESGHPTSRLLYITPEKLMSSDFMSLLNTAYEQQELSRLVIDEAHCISEWGHDFRAEYRKLGLFRERFPNVPIMALTASATPLVQEDIINNLGFSNDHLFKYQAISEYISNLTAKRGQASCGIIYARTRQTCDDLAEYLRRKGIQARPYHRGVQRARLDATLRDWSDGNRCDVVVATVCFGMGIDKPDVRYVIHFDLPQSFEGYYQETGRAGRDGDPSKCIIYYSREDVVKIKKLVRNSFASRERRNLEKGGVPPSQRAPDSLDQLIKFCESANVCRHVGICSYFGETIDIADPAVQANYCDRMCDVCKYPEKTKRNKASLSSDDFVSTQRPMLEQEATTKPNDLEEDVDGYPVPLVRPSAVKTMNSNSRQELSAAESLHPAPAIYQSSPVQPRLARPNLQSLHKQSLGGYTKDGFWQTAGPTGISAAGMTRRAPGSSDFGMDEVMTSTGLRRGRGDEDEDEEIVEIPAPKPKKMKQTQLSMATSSSVSYPNSRRTFKPPFKDKSAGSGLMASHDGPVRHNIYEDNVDFVSRVSKSGVSSSMKKDMYTGELADRATPELIEARDEPQSSPVKFDTEHGEVDASSSRKISIQLRESTMQRLRTSLHKGFMIGLRGEDYWVRLDGGDLSVNERSALILEAARQLEFLVWCHSAGESGYKERASTLSAAVKSFTTSDLGGYISPSISTSRKGKGKPVDEPKLEDTIDREDIDGIIRTLRKLVQAAAKKPSGSWGTQPSTQPDHNIASFNSNPAILSGYTSHTATEISNDGSSARSLFLTPD